ncbi:hypothetical protein [Streptomyces sp. NPDC002676]
MGLDLNLCMVDWERLRAVPVEDRIQALDDAIWPPDQPDQESAWCAEYHFLSTSGSYRPHARAGDAWDDMRALVDAAVCEAMDGFLNGLIWDEDPTADPALTGGAGIFPPAADRWRPHILLVCPPEAVSGKVQAWERVEPRLEELRGPFRAECEGWAGRPDSFEEFTALLREWAEVVRETARRGWGLVGLP